MSKTIKHIAIAGNIGAGKTTLCTLLSEHYNWEVHYESTDDNPYLSDFYDDMQRWSFHLQIYFLNSRYKQILKIKEGDATVIQDRTIYEDAFIFAPNLHDMSLMNNRDFENYFQLFQTMSTQIAAPDLMIYLRSSVDTLLEHIKKRGRGYEDSIDPNYLTNLNDRYEEWIKSYKAGNLLILDIDSRNFKENADDFKWVVEQIDEQLAKIK